MIPTRVLVLLPIAVIVALALRHSAKHHHVTADPYKCFGAVRDGRTCESVARFGCAKNYINPNGEDTGECQ